MDPKKTRENKHYLVKLTSRKSEKNTRGVVRSCDFMYRVRESKSKLEVFYQLFIKFFLLYFLVPCLNTCVNGV